MTRDHDSPGGIELSRSQARQVQGGPNGAVCGTDVGQEDFRRVDDEVAAAGDVQRRDGAAGRARQRELAVDAERAARSDGQDRGGRVVRADGEAAERGVEGAEIDGALGGADAEGQHGAVRQGPDRAEGERAGDGGRALVGGGCAQGERARTELGEAARTRAEAGGDRDVGAEVQGRSAFADVDRTKDDRVAETGGEA